MQKKEGMKPASGANDKCFEVTPSRMSENAFLECRTNITLIQSYIKVIYYIVLYSINIIVGIISSSCYWKI